MESGYAPPGAEYDSNAPWNNEERHNGPHKITVTVSICLSKEVEISVDDYEITDCGDDGEGGYYENIGYSNCNLKEAVEDQITLPHELGDILEVKAGNSREARIAKDAQGWHVDELEVIYD